MGKTAQGARLWRWPSLWCKGLGMASPGSPVSRPPQRGGGIFIAFGLVAGAVGGMLAGQPSVGLLAGLGVGLLAAILLAVRDRR